VQVADRDDSMDGGRRRRRRHRQGQGYRQTTTARPKPPQMRPPFGPGHVV
jgi:hypothetical protein